MRRSLRAASAQPDDRKPRGGFGYDFEYVQGSLEIDGARLDNIGIRFKGNSSYATTAKVLKRPFKIDLDRHVKGQSFKGVKRFVLNNNVMDTLACREALAYSVYREAGVPAPRTAYAQLRLTVPGKYKGAMVGLYTLVETVDRPLLADRFGDSSGLLLKPERVGPLDYLGEKWDPYEQRYRPKTKARAKAQRRLIELTRLVQQADDARLRREIGSLLDVDGFLRYVAATVLLSSLDSFIGFAHNYYLYLNPKTDRFVILPWDLDHSFGGLLMLGSANDLMNLSIRQPTFGRNRLVETLLSDEKTFTVYKGHIDRLLKTTFTNERFLRDVTAINAVLGPYREVERAAVLRRGDNWSLWGMALALNRAPEPIAFVAKRIESVNAQLAGKSTGTLVKMRFGGPNMASPDQLVRPVLTAADKDKNGKLSRDEVAAGVRALFKACDRPGKGVLDQRSLQTGLARLLPRPLSAGAIPAGLSRAIVERAGDKDGKVSEKSLLAAAENLFVETDKDRSGTLDEKELTAAARLLLPPGFGLPPPVAGDRPARPADATKKPGEAKR